MENSEQFDDTGVTNLLTAVFRAAAEEDYRKICEAIRAKFKNKYKASDFIDKNQTRIKKLISVAITEEALNWPGYTAGESRRARERILYQLLREEEQNDKRS